MNKGGLGGGANMADQSKLMERFGQHQGEGESYGRLVKVQNRKAEDEDFGAYDEDLEGEQASQPF